MSHWLVARWIEQITLSCWAKAVEMIQPDLFMFYSMPLEYNINLRINPWSEIPLPILSAADWFSLEMIDGSLRCLKQTRVSVFWYAFHPCLVCVQSAFTVRLRILAAPLPCVCSASTQRPHRARSACIQCPLSVHAGFTLRQRCVHAAFTLIFLESDQH